jgi:hypothetical protein
MDYLVKTLIDYQIQTLGVLEQISGTLEDLAARAQEMEFSLQSIKEELERRRDLEKDD